MKALFRLSMFLGIGIYVWGLLPPSDSSMSRIVVLFLLIVRGLKEGAGGAFFFLQECWYTGQRRRGAWRLGSQCGKLQLRMQQLLALMHSRTDSLNARWNKLLLASNANVGGPTTAAGAHTNLKLRLS